MSGEEMAFFGARVLHERKARNWSTRELASRAGVAVSLVSRVENTRSDVGLSYAVKIARALGVPLGELVVMPACVTCDGKPPAGFTCNSCGRSGV